MLKIVVIAIICAFLVLTLKSFAPELAAPALVGSGIIIIYYAVIYLSETFSVLKSLADLTGIGQELYKIIFKISAIAYIIEFSAGIIEDFGLKSLSDKLTFAGKIVILTVALPIIKYKETLK